MRSLLTDPVLELCWIFLHTTQEEEQMNNFHSFYACKRWIFEESLAPESGGTHVVAHGDEVVGVPHVLQLLGQEGGRAQAIFIDILV